MHASREDTHTHTHTLVHAHCAPVPQQTQIYKNAFVFRVLDAEVRPNHSSDISIISANTTCLCLLVSAWQRRAPADINTSDFFSAAWLSCVCVCVCVMKLSQRLLFRLLHWAEFFPFVSFCLTAASETSLVLAGNKPGKYKH